MEFQILEKAEGISFRSYAFGKRILSILPDPAIGK